MLPCRTLLWSEQNSKCKITSDDEEHFDKLFTFHMELLLSRITAAAPTLLHVQAVSDHHPLLLSIHTANPISFRRTFNNSQDPLFPAHLTLPPSLCHPQKKGNHQSSLAFWEWDLHMSHDNLYWRNQESRESGAAPGVPRMLSYKWNDIESCQEIFPRGEIAEGAREGTTAVINTLMPWYLRTRNTRPS